MKRRPLIALLIGVGLTRRGTASEKTALRLRRIAVLAADPSDFNEQWRALVSELAVRGHVAGKSVVFDTRSAVDANRAQLAKLAAELVRSKPDVLLTIGGSEPALAAKKATSSVPIVFIVSGDPLALGLVASLARPGGNITGSSSQSFDTYAKSLELLVQLAGGLKRVVAIDPKGEGLKSYFPSYAAVLTASAKATGATIRFIEYDSVDAVEELVRRLVEQGMDAAFLGDGPAPGAPSSRRIADIFIANRVPTVGNAEAGMLLGYTSSWKNRISTSAEYLDRILNGAKPADLPVPQPNAFELTINMKTAKAIGLAIPESLLLRAEKVIR